MKEKCIESTFLKKEDTTFDKQLRPQRLYEFTGQDSLKKRLEVLVKAAQKRDDILAHCLLYGPPGLGKTTLATILANEMNSPLTVVSGPSIEKPGDLAGILTSLKERSVLFIDEIHRLNKHLEEYLYPAMEDFKLDIMLDSGPSSRSVQVELPPFTLIGATTRSGLLSSPLRSRFGFHHRLDYYSHETLKEILERSCEILDLNIPREALLEIAKRSRGTPRIGNHLVKWVRDFCEVQTNDTSDLNSVNKALAMLSIDHKGLDEMDHRILTTIIDHHSGGPVGLKTISASVGEEESTISEVYEPFLIMQGLLQITQRGRKATKLAYEHLNKPQPSCYNDGDVDPC